MLAIPAESLRHRLVAVAAHRAAGLGALVGQVEFHGEHGRGEHQDDGGGGGGGDDRLPLDRTGPPLGGRDPAGGTRRAGVAGWALEGAGTERLRPVPPRLMVRVSREGLASRGAVVNPSRARSSVSDPASTHPVRSRHSSRPGIGASRSRPSRLLSMSASRSGPMSMSASAATRPGRCSARAVATLLPVECPITVTRPTPSRSRTAPARRAWAGMSYPPAGLDDLPWPGW